MLWSCQSWRQVVLSELLKGHSVLADVGKIGRRMTNWPTDLDYPSSFNASWVKIINVHISFPIPVLSSDYSEANHGELQVLENSRLLVFDMDYHVNSGQGDPDTSNPDPLIQYLCRIAPNIDKIQLKERRRKFWQLLKGYAPWASCFIRALVNQMASRKLDIAFNFLSNEKMNLDIHNSLSNQRQLTYANIRIRNSADAIQLIRSCADTLQILKFRLWDLCGTCVGHVQR